MTNKEMVLKEINSNPSKAMEALETMYHNRTYAIISYNKVDKFFKTRRGAEGHQKRQGNISWYDDYTQKMVTADSGTVTEIQDHEIVDPTTSKKMWYQYIRKNWSNEWVINNVIKEAEAIIIDSELLQWVSEFVEDIKQNNCFTFIEELADIEDLEKIVGSKEYYAKQEKDKTELLQQGADRIKKAGRINTNDFEDIAEQLKYYGLGFVDAQNQITALYLHQLEQEEKTEATTEPSAPEQAEENNGLKVEISYNEEKNGIELKFDGKPSSEVREQLKANGFRWSKYQKIWYAKDTEERRAFAESFNGTVTSEPKAFEYPEIDIDDLEDYKIDPELSRRENESNWIFRTEQRNHSQELQEILQHYQDQAIGIIEKTDNQEIIYHIKKDLQRFKKAYHSNYISTLTHRANNPSWAVTGRAGRNVRRDKKMMDRYDKLMSESIEIVNGFKQSLNRSRNKIRAANRQAVYEKIENTDIEISFTVKQKEVSGYSKRTYNHKNYMIVKIWGCYRIFKDGKEIADTKSTDTLNLAKKKLQYIINNETNEVINKAI